MVLIRELSLFIVILIFGCDQNLIGQIPGNTANRACNNELLSEDFGATVPMGWEGDWMLTAPPLSEGWILQSGASPDAPNTGANGPFSGTHFAYMETNGPAPVNSTFKINTPAITLTQENPTIRFRVLMHGSGIGQLKVNVLSGPGFGVSETVLTLTGEQHASSDTSNWEEAFIDIRKYSRQTVKVEFEGMKTNNGLGDIAIDLVQVCSETIVPTIGEWGLIVLGLILMIFGIISFPAARRASPVFSAKRFSDIG